MSERTLLTLSTPAREALAIPYHDLGDPGRRPRAALVAGLHGDEVNGVFVLARLAAFLQRVVAGALPRQTLRDRVLIVPAVNLAGVNVRARHWPFDGTDVNRMFPGAAGGETTQRLAARVLELTREAYYRVDIHASNLDFEELPQVRLYAPNDDERASACLFGLPAVIERPLNETYATTLNHAWRAHDGENFVIQAGQAGFLQRHHSEVLFRGLVAFLHRSGVLEGPSISEEEEDLHYFGPDQATALMAEHAGMFVSTLDVGRWVQRGEPLGHIYDAFDGSVKAEVTAPAPGLLTGLRRQPLLYQGDLMARVHCREAGQQEAHLHGTGQ